MQAGRAGVPALPIGLSPFGKYACQSDWPKQRHDFGTVPHVDNLGHGGIKHRSSAFFEAARSSSCSFAKGFPSQSGTVS